MAPLVPSSPMGPMCRRMYIIRRFYMVIVYCAKLFTMSRKRGKRAFSE